MQRAKIALSCLCAVLAIASGGTQIRPSPRSAVGGYVDVSKILTGISMLKRSDVRNEIKMTATQQSKYRGQESVLKTRVTSQKEVSKITSAAKSIKSMLSEKQRVRLSQLYYQAQGAFALGNDAVAKKVGLTDQQKKKIVDVRMQGLKKFDEERKREGKAFKPDLATTKWIMTNIEKVLKPDQMKVWKSMQGKQFKFSPPLRG